MSSSVKDGRNVICCEGGAQCNLDYEKISIVILCRGGLQCNPSSVEENHNAILCRSENNIIFLRREDNASLAASHVLPTQSPHTHPLSAHLPLTASIATSHLLLTQSQAYPCSVGTPSSDSFPCDFASLTGAVTSTLMLCRQTFF